MKADPTFLLTISLETRINMYQDNMINGIPRKVKKETMESMVRASISCFSKNTLISRDPKIP